METKSNEELLPKEVKRGVAIKVTKVAKDINLLIEAKKKKKELSEKAKGKIINFELLRYDDEFLSSHVIKPEFRISIPEDNAYFEAETQQKVFGEVVLRYSQGSRSMFAHLQPEDTKLTYIVFDSPIKSLNTNYDKKLIEFLSIAPICESSPYARPEYSFVYRKVSDEAMKKEVQNAEIINKAVTLINNARDESIYMACVNLGVDYSSASGLDAMRSMLVSLAIKSPQTVIDEIQTPNENLFLFKTALEDGGIIQKDGLYFETKTNKPMFPVINDEGLNSVLNKFFKEPSNKGIVEWLYEKYSL